MSCLFGYVVKEWRFGHWVSWCFVSCSLIGACGVDLLGTLGSFSFPTLSGLSPGTSFICCFNIVFWMFHFWLERGHPDSNQLFLRLINGFRVSGFGNQSFSSNWLFRTHIDKWSWDTWAWGTLYLTDYLYPLLCSRGAAYKMGAVICCFPILKNNAITQHFKIIWINVIKTCHRFRCMSIQIMMQ